MKKLLLMQLELQIEKTKHCILSYLTIQLL